MSETNAVQRVIQEYVPGKQITLAHIIANPAKGLSKKIGLVEETNNGIGILTITPSEAAIIAADYATKSADTEIGFIDRFSGTLVITGDVSAIESAIDAIIRLLSTELQFTPPLKITRS